MDPQPPLVDLTEITKSVNEMVAIIDPLLQAHFWNVTTGALLVTFGGVPGVILLLQLILAIGNPLVFITMFPITMPLTVGSGGYFGVLWLLIGPTVTELMAADKTATT
jgi:hypothetical protein